MKNTESSYSSDHHCTIYCYLQMVELMPGTGVYVYPATLRTVQKAESQTAKARHLLSVFYSNAELVEAGNLTGANGKPGLNQKIVTAIVGMLLFSSQAHVMKKLLQIVLS